MREELLQTLRLAVPLVLAELGWMAMGVVDTMFVGRVGAEAIGAVGLGTMVFYGIAICAAAGAPSFKSVHMRLVSGRQAIWKSSGSRLHRTKINAPAM